MALAKRFTIEPFWAGKTAVVIGGGPSLSLKQIRAIARARHQPASRFRVLAVNDAVYPAWFADWHHACDGTWWHSNIQYVHEFAGIKTTLGEDVPEPWVTGYLENSGENGFDPDPSRCRTGANGAFQAIHMLIHAGVKEIILFGVDMKESAAGEKHWFGDHPTIQGHLKVDYPKVMAPHFATLLPVLSERGVKVVNASPGTALETFPTVDFEKALL